MHNRFLHWLLGSSCILELFIIIDRQHDNHLVNFFFSASFRNVRAVDDI